MHEQNWAEFRSTEGVRQEYRREVALHMYQNLEGRSVMWGSTGTRQQKYKKRARQRCARQEYRQGAVKLEAGYRVTQLAASSFHCLWLLHLDTAPHLQASLYLKLKARPKKVIQSQCGHTSSPPPVSPFGLGDNVHLHSPLSTFVPERKCCLGCNSNLRAICQQWIGISDQGGKLS